jgi:hypothetical protein
MVDVITAATAFVSGLGVVYLTHSLYAVVEVPIFSVMNMLGASLAAVAVAYAAWHVSNWYFENVQI